MGTAYGPCQGQVVPVTETCNTTGDDDCDGQVNESGAGCLRLYTRPFPQVGTYTAEWIPAVWTGPNAPPATGILAAELNATAVRLMVWRNNGLYYERYNGVWQPPVSISSHFNNLNGNIIASATVTSAYVFDPNELLIITTNESPPRSITFLIPPAGNPIPDAPLAEIPDEMKPYGPPQHTTPLQWGATEHRWPSPANGDDWIVVWKGLGGTTYQQWAGPNFELYYQPPAPDATGPFQMNGVGSAPQAGTAVAAYYDAVLDRVSFIAP
jgi:hypothetical protein